MVHCGGVLHCTFYFSTYPTTTTSLFYIRCGYLNEFTFKPMFNRFEWVYVVWWWDFSKSSEYIDWFINVSLSIGTAATQNKLILMKEPYLAEPFQVEKLEESTTNTLTWKILYQKCIDPFGVSINGTAEAEILQQMCTRCSLTLNQKTRARYVQRTQPYCTSTR